MSELVDIFFKRLAFESLEWKSRIWGLVLCLEGTGESGTGAEQLEQGRRSILWRQAGLKQKGPTGSGTQEQEGGNLWSCCFIRIFFSFLAELKEFSNAWKALLEPSQPQGSGSCVPSESAMSAKPVVPEQLVDTSVVLWDHQVQAEPGDAPGTFCLL